VKYAPIPGKIPGTAVNLGGHEFIIAPLNLDLFIEHEKTISQFGSIEKSISGLERVLPTFLASIRRNYPDMTLEALRGLVDFGNFTQLTDAIVETNALKLKAPGESVPAAP
jgi:hypothetical protein